MGRPAPACGPARGRLPRSTPLSAFAEQLDGRVALGVSHVGRAVPSPRRTTPTRRGHAPAAGPRRDTPTDPGGRPGRLLPGADRGPDRGGDAARRWNHLSRRPGHVRGRVEGPDLLHIPGPHGDLDATLVFRWCDDGRNGQHPRRIRHRLDGLRQRGDGAPVCRGLATCLRGPEPLPGGPRFHRHAAPANDVEGVRRRAGRHDLGGTGYGLDRRRTGHGRRPGRR